MQTDRVCANLAECINAVSDAHQIGSAAPFAAKSLSERDRLSRLLRMAILHRTARRNGACRPAQHLFRAPMKVVLLGRPRATLVVQVEREAAA